MRLVRSLVPVLVAAAGLTVPLALAPGAQAAAPTCGGLKATIVGTNKANTINGTPQRDVIVARGGNDTIRGGGGNDVICGGEGADSISGGDGNDRLFGEADLFTTDRFGRTVMRGDTISGGAGDDTIDLGFDFRTPSEGTTQVLDGVSFADAPAPVVVDFQAGATVTVLAHGTDTVTGYRGVRVVGSELGDTIKGTNRDDAIYARGGDDTIFGRGGDDVLVADAAGDTAGNDRLYGDAGDDNLSGAAGSDLFVGSSGGDTLSSTSYFHQAFRGGSGIDTVTFPLPVESGFVAKGNGGQDRLRLQPVPNPALKPTLRLDQLKKTTIRDLQPYTLEGRITGFSDIQLPANTLSIVKGSNESEVITAHPDYRVKLYGRGGADVLTGSSQPDRLDGGKGFDIVRGRGGNDTCKAAERRSSC